MRCTFHVGPYRVIHQRLKRAGVLLAAHVIKDLRCGIIAANELDCRSSLREFESPPHRHKFWRVRPVVRTLPSQGGNRGSNPLRATKFRETLWSAGRACGGCLPNRVGAPSESESRETVPRCMVLREMRGQSRRSCRPPKHTGDLSFTPSSSGQDMALSRLEREFESPRCDQNLRSDVWLIIKQSYWS